MGYAAHQPEHGVGAREKLLLDGRLLFRRAGTHRPLAGRGCPPSWLEGDVKQADWDALCDNRHPQTGEQLTAPSPIRSHGGLRFQLPCAQERVAALCHDARRAAARCLPRCGRWHDARHGSRNGRPRPQRRQEREPHDRQHGVGRVHPFHVKAGRRRARSAFACPLLRVQHDVRRTGTSLEGGPVPRAETRRTVFRGGVPFAAGPPAWPIWACRSSGRPRAGSWPASARH